MSCEVHKSYKGLRKPRTDCKGCWDFYNEKKNATNKEETKSPKQKTGKKKVLRRLKNVSDDDTGGPSKANIQAETSGSDEVDVKEPESPPEETLSKADKKKIDNATKEYVDSIVKGIIKDSIDAKIKSARSAVERELNVNYEHLRVNDDIYHPNMIFHLEKEGWAWMFNSYPLAKNKIIPGGVEYTLFRRLKKSDNKPVPDFSNVKIVKKYSAKIK
jgi:hypothetical protein